ncbi:MAG: SDR family NAD(P)-dependent oxidoreductase [Rikenellaceae bacterium]|jgi:nucleoside-diphosphate-sugar epimerase|nr:SDR family NAD(P)-dependent oxidoreductase [Rikenellaceae bacterium]
MKEKAIAITGATGMLGAELTRQLIPSGASLRLVVRNRAKLAPLMEQWGNPAIEVIQTELTNPVELREAFTGVDIVFHCAAQVSFRLDENEDLVRANTDITHHVVNACIEAGVGRLIHVSSIAALGEPNTAGVITADSFPDSVAGWNGYSLSKFYSENEVWRGIRYGLKATIVNPSIILGPGPWKGEGSAALFAALGSGMPFYVPGGNAFVDVRDVAGAMMLLAEAEEAVGRRFILSGANVSFREFITLIAKSLGKRPPRYRLGERGLNRLRRMLDAVARLTRTKPLLSDDLVKAALTQSRYDGEAVKAVIPAFAYRPIEETIGYMAEAYLKDKQKR